MGRSPTTIWAMLALAWCAFAIWQFRTWRQEEYLIRETVHQQAHSVMNALTSGIRSHRRLGRFVQLQLTGILEGLAQTPDVLAVQVSTDGGQVLSAAGDTSMSERTAPGVPGAYWESNGFRLVEQVEILPSMAGEFGGGMPGPGGGLGHAASGSDPFDALRSEGGVLMTTLVLDRRRTDALSVGAAWSHGIATLAGGLVLIGLAAAWRGNVRLVAERGRSQLLEMEARHYRDLSQAAAGLAHETRNPLGLVRGWTERLANSDVDTEHRQRQARAVIEECDRVTARINEFLAFARPCEPTLSPVRLRELCDELQVILQPDTDVKQIELTFQTHEQCQTVEADRELLRQALFNLVQNALQSAPDATEVGIHVGPDVGATCQISVVDRGPGVAAEHVGSLFSPYFTTHSEGTGLGLAIVRRIAFAHGWTADYHPRPGGGSVFTLQGLQRERQTDDSDR